MKQNLQLDGHKLSYHPRLIADYLDGKDIVPFNVEISATSACNHRCCFCNFDYMGHSNISIPHGRLPVLVEQMGNAGVKTITFGGAGEPLLHPDVFPTFRTAKKCGMNMAMSTNGVLLTEEQINETVDLLSWIRFSMSGTDTGSYNQIHKCNNQDYFKAFGNMEKMAKRKRQSNSSRLTIGVQCLLLPENQKDVPELAKRVCEAGADYFVIKHFYQRAEETYRPDMSFRTKEYLVELMDMASKMSTDTFSFIVRDVEKLNRERPYTECCGLPFISYVGEDGMLYTCFSHHEDGKTAIGNVIENDFLSVWNSQGKKAAIDYINTHFDKNQCQANCRHHQINLYLNSLKNPPRDVNFL